VGEKQAASEVCGGVEGPGPWGLASRRCGQRQQGRQQGRDRPDRSWLISRLPSTIHRQGHRRPSLLALAEQAPPIYCAAGLHRAAAISWLAGWRSEVDPGGASSFSRPGLTGHQHRSPLRVASRLATRSSALTARRAAAAGRFSPRPAHQVGRPGGCTASEGNGQLGRLSAWTTSPPNSRHA